jgi:tight adherence protein B
LLADKAPPPLSDQLKFHWTKTSLSSTDKRLCQLLSDDALHLAQAALLLSLSSGGRVADVLEKAGLLLQTKLDMEEKIHAFTLQGKASAWIVGGSPFLLLAVFSVFSPDFISPLFTTRVGLSVLGAALVMVGVGLFFVHRATKMEV